MPMAGRTCLLSSQDSWRAVGILSPSKRPAIDGSGGKQCHGIKRPAVSEAGGIEFGSEIRRDLSDFPAGR